MAWSFRICGSLSVFVRWLLVGGCCLLIGDVCCRLFVGVGLLRAVRCVLIVVRCWVFVVCGCLYVLVGACCLLVVVSA